MPERMFLIFVYSEFADAVTEKKDADGEKKETAAEAKPAAKPAAAKPKKAPPKPLPEMMQEEIIPPLKTALEAEEDVSQVELSFQNNTVRSSGLIASESHALNMALLLNYLLRKPRSAITFYLHILSK
jgi:hypothetical protein